jgi:hypothetical protein
MPLTKKEVENLASKYWKDMLHEPKEGRIDMKYRKKPVVVEALRFNGDNFKECKNFIGDNYDNTLNFPNIKTLEGTMAVNTGDWIIKGVKGEFYPCKPDIFELTYEKVEE